MHGNVCHVPTCGQPLASTHPIMYLTYCQEVTSICHSLLAGSRTCLEHGPLVWLPDAP